MFINNFTNLLLYILNCIIYFYQHQAVNESQLILSASKNRPRTSLV